MLMDLFYDEVPVEKKQRVHFHSFMLDVHSSMYLSLSCVSIIDSMFLLLLLSVVASQLFQFYLWPTQSSDLEAAVRVGKLVQFNKFTVKQNFHLLSLKLTSLE